jgi:hypothetical protein
MASGETGADKTEWDAVRIVPGGFFYGQQRPETPPASISGAFSRENIE